MIRAVALFSMGSAFGGTVAALAAPPVAGASDRMCGIVAADARGFEKAVRADKRFAPAKAPKSYVNFVSAEDQAIWTFATAENPAYPAAVCRQVEDEGGVMTIRMKISCQAAASACDKLTRTFEALNDSGGDAGDLEGDAP